MPNYAKLQAYLPVHSDGRSAVDAACVASATCREGKEARMTTIVTAKTFYISAYTTGWLGETLQHSYCLLLEKSENRIRHVGIPFIYRCKILRHQKHLDMVCFLWGSFKMAPNHCGEKLFGNHVDANSIWNRQTLCPFATSELVLQVPSRDNQEIKQDWEGDTQWVKQETNKACGPKQVRITHQTWNIESEQHNSR